MRSTFFPISPSVESCLSIKISNFKKWGHLEKIQQSPLFQYSWSKGGKKVGQIVYMIKHLHATQKELYLSYSYKKQEIRYKIDLVASPSNLGVGQRWYFVCPKTNQKCMALVCLPGQPYFYHRTAFTNLMYESQKKSKSWREMEAVFRQVFE